MTSRLVQAVGFLEVRRCSLHAAGRKGYLKAYGAHLAASKPPPGYLATLIPAAGADLSAVLHLSSWASLDERDASEAEVERAHEAGGLANVAGDSSEIYAEALECTLAAGAAGNGSATHFAIPDTAAQPGVYEWREYQLELGYNPIPKLREAFARGLPSKIEADEERRAQIAMMAYTDVGPLNRFVEVGAAPRSAPRARQHGVGTVAGAVPVPHQCGTTHATTLCLPRPPPPPPGVALRVDAGGHARQGGGAQEHRVARHDRRGRAHGPVFLDRLLPTRAVLAVAMSTTAWRDDALRRVSTHAGGAPAMSARQLSSRGVIFPALSGRLASCSVLTNT